MAERIGGVAGGVTQDVFHLGFCRPHVGTMTIMADTSAQYKMRVIHDSERFRRVWALLLRG